MKKIILNFEKKTDNFKDLVQEAFNMNFLNFLLSEETYSELEEIERNLAEAVLLSKKKG